jgi:hypothetical protein
MNLYLDYNCFLVSAIPIGSRTIVRLQHIIGQLKIKHLKFLMNILKFSQAPKDCFDDIKVPAGIQMVISALM